MVRVLERPEGHCELIFTVQEEEHVRYDGQNLSIFMKEIPGESLGIKEVFAKAVKELKKYKIKEASADVSLFCRQNGISSIRDITEGALLAEYEQETFPPKEKAAIDLGIFGLPAGSVREAQELVKETETIARGIIFARDVVNRPGNMLRPLEFAKAVEAFAKEGGAEVEIISGEALSQMGMGALLGVGASSQHQPCLLVMRYMKDPDSEAVLGLIGKGVTVDTGGYCLKPAKSMAGIKGDMAGGAAVAGAIFALAGNHVKANVIGVIPMCENRISPGSILPGDVITSYSGKTIEVLNTDAEGRLILADAVSYAIKKEGVNRIADIATLTGSVVNMLGFSIGGVLSDSDELFSELASAGAISGERYHRLPFYKEHEKMMESRTADIKNIGEDVCGTITAGLFIRSFAEGLPWLHIDIAGTAWVDSPVFEFQSKGATGAGVTSLYYLCKGRRER